ncbi:MAG: hypothetical protein ACD_70C00088G0002 [uncultured bacterium]|nr:MAG: hypothetical protein ACD_70C00088G0002 [uncultured bacterium]OGT27102.1 MAG: hypothetical protein A3B71_02330 [Gammaproteobacteria bacterium RIFCSPHIGHO2_02_FULL_42_43]OGT53550.1 MAG: hypothetical protein A3E54_02355 [Gammaproteobacteria bacterium RIFCSPHIGHO2_12_FULL_41_25]OGT61495.1 MAG: hypothetical protein A3I77_02490 [Gammaproteobacteria bacterium RIFCSPLOWO2_02_FULL_42_14]OGT86500.1 MAG: hypothetical protein A3G86_02425 [Gammaproteobacteria bacterium RIFCSPLOWO2_12_FULL_42_18]
MPIFAYEARNKTGVLQKGRIEADNSDQAATQLSKNNLVPIKIQTVKTQFHWHFPKLTMPKFKKKISRDVLSVFSRQMYSLYKAGIPIVSSIQRLAKITTQPALALALHGIAKDIASGTSLSKAMGHYPDVFPSLIIALVVSGEINGRLDEAFLSAAKHYELQSISHKRLKSILRYPLLVLGFSFAAIMLINVFVIPRFAQLYSKFSAQLPLPTRMLIHFSNFIQNYWWLIIIVMLLTAILIRYFLNYDQWLIYIDRKKLKLPIFGPIFENILMADFSHGLAILLKTGITLIQSLRLTADIVNNHYARKQILEMLELIERGKNFSQAANAVNFLSPLLLQILSVGEKTGNVDNMLFEASTSYEQEIEFDIKRLGDRIEPVLLVMVGGIVLLLALGVFLPMWSLVYNAK